MGCIGNETPLLPHQLIYPFQQTIDGVYKRGNLLRQIIAWQLAWVMCRLLIQTPGQLGDGVPVDSAQCAQSAISE